MSNNIAYICDRKACEYCDGLDCHHTFEIEHAVNFKKLDEARYIEEPNGEPMTGNAYQTLAMRTAREACRNLSNVGLGLAGEAGECADIIKKYLHQGHPFNREKFLKELGDVAWYLALGCTVVGAKLDDVLRGNIEKLKNRYPDGFDPEHSINRAEDDV